MKKCLVLLLGSVLLFTSCKESSVAPKPVQNPPGYQVDISWPSLADSPWPMNHHDPQNTGRSKLLGPQLGQIAFFRDSIKYQTGISIGIDSSIYAVSSYPSYLYAFKEDGSTKWRFDIQDNESYQTPLVSKDGTIYVTGSFNNKIFAVNPDGTQKWVLSTPENNRSEGLVLGIDGNIYYRGAGGGNKLYVVSPMGTLLNTITLQNNTSQSGISFSRDGKIAYLSGVNCTVTAYDLVNNNTLWSYGEGGYFAAPLVDTDGNIYVWGGSDSAGNTSPSVVSLWSNGTPRWIYNHGNILGIKNSTYLAEMTLDKNGNLYFALDTLYSLDYNGKLRWKSGLGGKNWSPLVCDAEGTIYVSTLMSEFSAITAFTSSGQIKWKLPINSSKQIYPSYCSAITYNRTLIVPTYRGQGGLFIVK